MALKPAWQWTLTRRQVLVELQPKRRFGWGGGVGVRYSVLIESVNEAGFEGYYYAHVPSLDLTTDGRGIEGALQAAQDLVEAWVAEKRAHGETIPTERQSVIAHIEVPDAILRP